MDIFKSLIRALGGKTNELEKPVFAKPYADKTDDLLELVSRLETAPEEAKPMFRDAVTSLREKIRAHRNIFEVLDKSDLPIVVLYDVHLLTPIGSAIIDYVVISNRFVLALSCPPLADEPTPEEMRATASPGGRRRLSLSEHAAHILTGLLREEKMLGKKELSMIWPATVLPDEMEQKVFPEQEGAFSDGGGYVYGEVRTEASLKVQELDAFLRRLFKMDDKLNWISNDKVFAIASLLQKYDTTTEC